MRSHERVYLKNYDPIVGRDRICGRGVPAGVGVAGAGAPERAPIGGGLRAFRGAAGPVEGAQADLRGELRGVHREAERGRVRGGEGGHIGGEHAVAADDRTGVRGLGCAVGPRVVGMHLFGGEGRRRRRRGADGEGHDAAGDAGSGGEASGTDPGLHGGGRAELQLPGRAVQLLLGDEGVGRGGDRGPRHVVRVAVEDPVRRSGRGAELPKQGAAVREGVRQPELDLAPWGLREGVP